MQIDVKPVTEAVITLFVVMIFGIIGRLSGVLNPKTTKGLSEVLVKITQPLLIIGLLQIPFTDERLNTGLWLIAISGIVHIVVSIFSKAVYRNQPLKRRKVFISATVFGNCAFIGFPVLKAVFPVDGLFYGAFYTFFFNLYLWTYGTYVLSRGSTKEYKPLKSLLNVGTIACGVSLLLFLLNIRLPSPVLGALNSIGNITFPLSMLIIGSLIGGLGIRNMFSGKEVYIYSAIKLLAMPIITLLACVMLGIDKGLTLLLVVMNSVPSAANNAIFAEIYGADASLSSKLIGVSTLFSVVTIPLMLIVSSWMLNITG